MVEWLKVHLKSYKSTIMKAGVFGSIALGTSKPNDCDLFIITTANPESVEWHELKKNILKLKGEFSVSFKIPLNIILLSLNEWEEKKEFFSTYKDVA